MIIGIDLNDDVQNSPIARRLKQRFELKDGVLSRHFGQSPPATFNRNTSRTAIAAIYISDNLEVLQAGYMPFDSDSPAAKSDGHRMLWIMLCNLSLFGKHIPCSTHALNIDRVVPGDPRSRKIYHREVKKEYNRQHIPKTKRNLEKDVKAFQTNKWRDRNSKFKSSFKTKFDDFHSKTRKIKTKVGEKMRRICRSTTIFTEIQKIF